MQEKKNKQLLIVMITLLLIIAGIYWWGNHDTAPTIDRDMFRVDDLKSINEIELQSPVGTTNLKYQASGWMINGKYPADRNMIDVLFATLQQAEPKRPVSTLQADSMVSVIEKSGVKVSLISGGELVKQFYAAGNERKSQTYFKNTGDPVSYLMTIPGYRVYVAGVFELGVNGWRDKFAFGFNWRNFKSLEAQYPKREADNFRAQFKESFFGIDGIESDTARLNSYLDAVSLLTVDEYIDSNPSLDSLLQTSPILKLTVQDISNNPFELQLYPPTSRNQFVVRVNNAWAVLGEAKVREILRPRAFFVKH